MDTWTKDSCVLLLCHTNHRDLFQVLVTSRKQLAVGIFRHREFLDEALPAFGPGLGIHRGLDVRNIALLREVSENIDLSTPPSLDAFRDLDVRSHEVSRIPVPLGYELLEKVHDSPCLRLPGRGSCVIAQRAKSAP